MSENQDAKGKFKRGNTARPYSPHKVAREKAPAPADTGDVDSTLRTAMLKALGKPKDLKRFLEDLRKDNAALFAKILAQLEPKDAREAVVKQIVMVYPAEPPADWEPPKIDDEMGEEVCSPVAAVAQEDEHVCSPVTASGVAQQHSSESALRADYTI